MINTMNKDDKIIADFLGEESCDWGMDVFVNALREFEGKRGFGFRFTFDGDRGKGKIVVVDMATIIFEKEVRGSSVKDLYRQALVISIKHWEKK